MARKSIKGYSEKNYYDNTKFSGITATHDILNEGAFRHMSNLDISDTGRSVTPRKGYLTTEFVDANGNPIVLTDSTIYFQEPNTGEYIFIDMCGMDLTVNDTYTETYNPNLTFSCDWSTVTDSYIPNTIIKSDIVEEFALHLVGDNKYIPKRITFKNDIEEVYINSYLKYPDEDEDDYIISSESHIISKTDTNCSIILLVQEERLEGVLTTISHIKYNLCSTASNIIMKLDEYELAVNSSSLYANIVCTGSKRAYDNGANYSLATSKFKTTFSIKDNKIATSELPHVNANDLLSYLGITKSQLIDLKPVGSNFAEIMYNEYGVKQNVIKVQYLEQQFWINLVYNKSEDTLYIMPVSTNDPVAVDITNRNIASSESIIPDPTYSVYENGKAPIGHYNRIPMIYAKQNGKYLINTANTLSGLELKPSFFIEDFDSTYEWAYTYDIRSTSPLVEKTYKSPVYKLKDHFNIKAPNIFEYNEEFISSAISGNGTITSTDQIVNMINSLDWSKDSYLSSDLFTSNTYVIYVTPIPPSTIRAITKDNYTPLYTSTPEVNFNANEYELLRNIIVNNTTYTRNTFITDDLSDCNTLALIERYFANKEVRFFIKQLNTLEAYDYESSINPYLYNYSASVISSKMMILPNRLLTLSELIKNLKDVVNSDTRLCFKEFDTISAFRLEKDLLSYDTWDWYESVGIESPSNGLIVRDSMNAYFPVTSTDIQFLCTVDCSNVPSAYLLVHTEDDVNGYVPHYATTITFPKMVFNSAYLWAHTTLIDGVHNIKDSSLFTDKFTLTYDTSNEVIQRLKDNLFFENGLDITFYLLRRPLEIPEGMNYDIYGRELLISSSSLYQSRTVILDNNEVIYIPVQLTEEPTAIASATNSLVFRDTLGDHLVVWNNNQVFISEPSTYYYFKYTGMFSYPAKIIKVIQYKDTLLVFTAQDLYSIFPYESTIQVQDGTDDEGNPKYVQSKVVTYNTLPVLYNLMVDEQYADAIQVFNQMVLFYSADGQMFMIKPTATIDSNTRFSIQYFNKSANDILANYHEYINERLQEYNIDKVVTKDNVLIKVLVNINYIKIFYCVPDVITYILIYDVINNYYTVYDTVAYSHVTDFINHEGFELYCTKHKDRMYITFPYRDVYHTDNNTDISSYYNFSPFEIHAELDTGNINLNNHIKKRFRTLYNTYKNIDAHELIYTVESFVDDVPVLTRVQDTIEIKNIDGATIYVPTEISNAVNLLADNSALFDFSAYNMNKIINHRSNIICSGKSIRLRLRFTSKGKYKILGYGLIYKEHHV